MTYRFRIDINFLREKIEIPVEVLLTTSVLCKWGGRNIHRLFANPSFGFGLTNINQQQNKQ